MTQQALIGVIVVAVLAVAALGAAFWLGRRAGRSAGVPTSLLSVLGVSTLVAAVVLLIAALAPAANEADEETLALETGEGSHSSGTALDEPRRVDAQYYPSVLNPDQPPTGFPPLDVTHRDGAEPGTVLFTTFTSPRAEADQPYHPSFMAQIDKESGDIVRARQVLSGTWIFRPEPDGRYTYNVVDVRGEAGAGFESTNYVVDERLDAVEAFDLSDLEGGGADPHDYRLLDNGNMLQLSYRERDANLSEFGGPADGRVLDTVIAETTPDGETVWLWDGAEHMDLADVTEPVAEAQYTGGGIADHTHPNSLYVFDDGDVLVSIRHYDCILRIDRPSGDIVWTLGGPNCAQNDFEIIGDPHDGFSHQHDATVLDNGNILLFDNGNLRDDPVSRVVEYAIDEEAMTAELVWSYDDGRYTPIMGSAQRLDNGNTLIGWGALHAPAISEVTPEGEEVFSVGVPEGQLVYRAYQGEAR